MSRYLLAAFVKNFLLTIVGLVLILLLASVFDEFNKVIRNHPPAWAIAAYFLSGLPLTLAQALPMAVLVATLFTLAGMLRSHELVAMRAAGMSQWALSVPFLVPTFLLSLATIVFGETVLPWATAQHLMIKKVYIRKQPLHELLTMNRAALWSGDGKRLIYAEQASGPDDTLHGVTILEFSGLTVTTRVDAEQGRPVAGKWELDHAQVYRWHGTEPDLSRHKLAVYPLNETMKDFLQEPRPVETLSMAELRDSIQRLQNAGRESGEEQVFYYLKWAFPFANFIVALLALGISFTFQTNPRAAPAAAFGVAIGAALCYIVFEQFGEVLGVGGALPPLFAMWMANGVFLAVGLVLLWRAWRF
jgi:lipopolysaccharide export system permease protein